MVSFDKLAGPYPGPAGGLAWDGSAMLFATLGESRIRRYVPKSGETSVVRSYTNRTNGLAFGRDGALYGCQELSRRIVRFNGDGSTEQLSPLLDGAYHNQPNNLVVDSRGHIWFSDPWSELRASGPQIFPPLAHASVLRLELDAFRKLWTIRRMTWDTAAPRAVALAPDEKTLYVAETDNRPGGRRELRAYPVRADGTLGAYALLHLFGADHRGVEGMCVDGAGNIFACAGWKRSGPGPLVYVFSPSGAPLASYAVPADEPMNCAFGEPHALYVTTAGGELYRASIPSGGR